MNTFTIDTDKYYPVCYKITDAKTFKNLVYYFILANHHVYYNIHDCTIHDYRLACLTGAFRIIAIDF